MLCLQSQTMRRRIARTLHSSVVLVLLCACGSSESSGPITRIHRFTGCEVPPGAVRVHEHVGGDATHAVIHAKVVIPKPTIDAFVASCGFERGELVSGFDLEPMRPDEPLPWWNPPEPRVGFGGSRGDAAIFVVERDTDFAVWVTNANVNAN